MSESEPDRASITPSCLSKEQVLLMYYKEKDVFFSTEGIFKLVSILVCVVAAVLSASSGACERRGGVLASAAVPLAVAALLALLVAARALQLPRKAPGPFILTDMVVCSVSGAATLVSAALGAALCHRHEYLHAMLALCVSGMVTASACLTYCGAMRAWDCAAGPATAAPTRHEQDA